MAKSGVSAQNANVETKRTVNRRAAVLVRMPVIVPSTLVVAPDANSASLQRHPAGAASDGNSPEFNTFAVRKWICYDSYGYSCPVSRWFGLLQSKSPTEFVLIGKRER